MLFRGDSAYDVQTVYESTKERLKNILLSQSFGLRLL